MAEESDPLNSAADRSLAHESLAPWTWLQLAGLLSLVVLFAGILAFSYASLEWRRIPASQRLNNGAEPTFFAFHINPYYNFSEDFHLYYVRAKRILDRGWTDSVMYHREGEGRSYVAPLQVALSMIALKTDGRPIPYAIFMFGVLVFGWGALLVAARLWLPRSFHNSSLLLAVFGTVCFEGIHLIFLEPRWPGYGIWPNFRGLRMATMAWTNPLLLAAIIGMVSLYLNPARRRRTLAGVAAIMLVLLGADNWAFGLAWTALGLTFVAVGVHAGLAYRRTHVWPANSLSIMGLLAAFIVASYGLHGVLSSALRGDALLRAGFGPEWRGVDQRQDLVPELWKWCGLALSPVLLIGALGRLEVRPTGEQHSIIASRRPWRSGSMWHYLWAIALLPLFATIVLYNALKFGGAEPFLRYQLYWRANFCEVFPFLLVLLEWVRVALLSFNQPAGRRWAVTMAAIFIPFLGYHGYRSHKFVRNVARHQFYLTADEERLRDWLEQWQRGRGHYELATLSPELNYLAAYWTDADLLLPSGFPYHTAESNDEIEARALALLRLYNVDPRSWLRVTFPLPRSFCDDWVESKVAAAGEGFLYHLFHRTMTLKHAPAPRFNEIERERVGELLREPGAIERLEPEVILIDPVSRALGQPNLAAYRRTFRSNSIEAWVRNPMTFASGEMK